MQGLLQMVNIKGKESLPKVLLQRRFNLLLIEIFKGSGKLNRSNWKYLFYLAEINTTKA